MFCQKCGIKNNKQSTYCRACGEIISDEKTNGLIYTAINTPKGNADLSTAIGIFWAFISFFIAFWIYMADLSVPILGYIGITLAIGNAIFHLINVGLTRKILNKLKPKIDEQNEFKIIDEKDNDSMLNEAKLADTLFTSVTEFTTDELKEKVSR